MPFADGVRLCTTVILDRPPARTDDRGGRAAVDAWFSAVLAACARTGAFEVFCDIPVAPDPAQPVRRHSSTHDLGQALRTLRALEARPFESDIAWIVVDTRVPPGWDARLLDGLHSRAGIGTLSPVCVDDPMLSPWPVDARDPAPPLALLDGWLADHAPSEPAQVPRPLRHCGALKPEAAEAIARPAPLDTDDRPTVWHAAALRTGLVHAVSQRVAVSIGRSADLSSEPAGETLLGLHGLGETHPLQALRRLAALGPPFASGRPAIRGQTHRRPVRLHFSHSWGGGLGAWVRDFCRADDAHEGLVLRSIGVRGAFGQRLALYHHADPVTPLRTWTLDVPIHATAISHLQYRAILEQIADEFDVASMFVSSLIGHSLDVLRTGRPTLIVAHDHMPLCVALYAHFEGECRSCDTARLEHCIRSNPAHAFFVGVRADDWELLRRTFSALVLERHLRIVAPSPSTAQRWRNLMPDLAHARISVIPHGIDLPAVGTVDPPGPGRLRLVMIGRLSPEKGSALLEAILPDLLSFADLTLLGCGEEALRLGRDDRVRAIPSFEPAELPELLASARPHLGMLLSIVPETFSYALSELWHFGIPVLGCRTGSLADRIVEPDNGYLCDPSAASILSRLREIDRDRTTLASTAARLRSMRSRTCAEMVTDYDALLPWQPQRRPDRPADSESESTGSGRLRIGPLSIDHQAGFAVVSKAFANYALNKAAHSPRMPATLRTGLQRWMIARSRRRAAARARQVRS